MKNHVQKMTCQPCFRQRPECPGCLPAQQRGRAQTQPSHQAGVRGRRTKKGPSSPREKGRKSSASGKCRGRPRSALVRVVVTSWRGVSCRVSCGRWSHGPCGTLVRPFPPLQARPTRVSGGRRPPVTGGGWASSVEAELTSLTQPSCRLQSCRWA